MKKLGIVLAGWVAMSTLPATAADMAVKAAPYIEPAYSWTGFYLGINSGFSRGEHRWHNPAFLTRADQVTFGSLFGVTGGYNWQFGSWVAGVEADWDWTNISGEVSCPNAAFRCGSNLRDIGTIRGRLGYTVKNFMFFVTGGGAWADQRVFIDRLATDTRTSETQNRWGYAAGFGLEWAPWGPNWSYKFEWLYYDVGGDNYARPGSALFAVNGSEINSRANGHMWRTGINYHFNLGGPVRASY
jgi:outer membrane immunogenic protein